MIQNTKAKTLENKPLSELPLGRSLLLVLALAVAAALLLPAGAIAGTSRVAEGSIGALSEGEPTGIAVDQSNGDIYMIDATASKRRIYRFDSSGAPKNFTAGPDAGTNTLTGFVPESNPFNHPLTRGPNSIAIDNSGGPLDGTIYVAEGTNPAASLIRVFDRSGASLGIIDGAGTPPRNEEPVGRFAGPVIAVDQSDGSLYVSSYGEEIWRYAPASPSLPLSEADYARTGLLGGPGAFGSLAVAGGNVYSAISGSLKRFSASEFLAEPKNANPSPPVLDTGVTGIAVDPATGDVYANEGYRVAVFDSTGQFLYRFGRIAEIGTKSRAVAVRSAVSGPAVKAYVGDEPNGRIVVFGSPTPIPTFVHPEIAAFGQDGTAATSFSVNSNLSPWGLAFKQTGSKLYTGDTGLPGVFGFDASSPPNFSPLAGFNPLSTPAPTFLNLAVDDTALASAGSVYLVTPGETGLLYGFSPSGAPLGGAFPVDPAVTPGAPVGSPKSLAGVAVDSSGHIWVSNFDAKRILEYSAAGVFLKSIDMTTEGRPGLLAFGSNDDLYVNVGGLRIVRYSASSGYTVATEVRSRGAGVAFAVDPSDDHIFAVSWADSLTGAGDREIAWMTEYDSAGALVDEFVIGVQGSSLPTAIAVDGATGNIYVADRKQAKVRVFGPGVSLPEVTVAPASNFTNTSATLNGAVSTQEVALTDCHFEYVTEAAFAAGGFSDLSSGGSVPCSPAAGSIPLDLDSHPVSASASGLVKDTDYRFRLSAANAQGENVSDSAKFSTAAKPDAETVGAPVVSATVAYLNGRVNPHNAGTTYHFEYGTDGPCDANPCLATPARAAGAGVEIKLVTERLAGLQPGTTYHYRLIADNGNVDGLGVGGDMTVTTRASDAGLSHGPFPGPPGSDRAYEQVSLPDSGGNPASAISAPLVSDDGDRAIYEVHGGTPISESGSSFGNVILAERPGDAHPQSGWQSRTFTPKRAELIGNPNPVWDLRGTDDLSSVLGVARNNFSPVFSAWGLPIPGEPAKLFESTPDQEQGGIFGVSEDGSRKLIALSGDVVDPAYPTAGQEINLYDVTTGTAQLASVLPNGLPACVSSSPEEAAAWMPSSDAPWISADGSLVFFASSGDAASCEGPVQLYVRDLQSAQSTSLSATPVSGPTCSAFLLRTTESDAYFWTKSRLAAEDSAASGCGGQATDGDVYRYELDDGSRDCLTCVVPGRDADVWIGNAKASAAEAGVGVSADGSSVYFQTLTSLLRGAPADGKPAVYRVDVAGDELAYVAPLAAGADAVLGRQALSADGSVLTFRSDSPGLNPVGGTDNGETLQYYRYDDRDRSLVCVSCDPQGAPAKVDADTGNLTSGNLMTADGGTIAFTTAVALVGADQNTPGPGVDPRAGTDLYEWRQGRLLLVTDGLARWPTKGTGFPAEGPKIAAITPSGRDLYFTAPIQYTTDALDGYRRLYDARVGGGMDFPPVPEPCALEVCQGTPKGVPAESLPGTSDFRGPGNPPAGKGAKKCPAGKRKVRRKGKTVCVRKRRAAKHNGGDNR